MSRRDHGPMLHPKPDDEPFDDTIGAPPVEDQERMLRRLAAERCRKRKHVHEGEDDDNPGNSDMNRIREEAVG